MPTLNMHADLHVQELISLSVSGLYEHCTAIHVFISANSTLASGLDNKEASDMISHWGVKYTIHTHDTRLHLYERLTLEQIKDHIKPSDKFLYMHSKGVTLPHTDFKEYWRRFLVFWNVRYWQVCVCLLDIYDTVGALETRSPVHHYRGNFWWTTGAFWLRHNTTIGPGYYDPEFFLFHGFPDARAFNMANKATSLYSTHAWPADYSNDLSAEMRSGAHGCYHGPMPASL